MHPWGITQATVWHSLWSAQDILKMGTRWRVGNGSRICMWQQPWLRDGLRHLNSLSLPRSENLTVADLCMQGSPTWNVDLLQALLEPKDVNRVLQVPVFGCGEEDKLIWAFSPNGVYSVKSGYRVCREQIAPASHLTVEGNWKGLWSLGVAPRVKACVWRACRDVLPTRTRLQINKRSFNHKKKKKNKRSFMSRCVPLLSQRACKLFSHLL